MSNLVDKEIGLQVMTCLDALLDRANHDEYLGRIGKKEALRFLEENSKYADIIKSNLHRLQSIDNAEPSEALKALKELRVIANTYCSFNGTQCEHNKELADIIEQALLKEQEPKQYVDELKLVEKKLKSLDLLMQELDCKDFAELRKYARCGYEKLKSKEIS